jgi:hypothetical protein
MDDPGLYCSPRCPISSPKHAYKCWADLSLNFKEPPNSSSLNISESKNHLFSSLKKKSRIKELLVPVISKNLKESMIFIKKIQQRTDGSSTNFFELYFLRTTVIHQNLFTHQNLRIGR